MCLCAFLYFNKFSTVNINYFRNQKKKPTVLLEEKIYPSYSVSPGSLPLRYRMIPSQQCKMGGGVRPFSLSCTVLVTASRKLQIPNKYQLIVRTSRSVSMATWQGHDTTWALPQRGDGPAGRMPTSNSLRLPKGHGAKGLGLPRLEERDTSLNNGTLEVSTHHPNCGVPWTAISIYTAANRCQDPVFLRAALKNEVSLPYVYLMHNFIILLHNYSLVCTRPAPYICRTRNKRIIEARISQIWRFESCKSSQHAVKYSTSYPPTLLNVFSEWFEGQGKNVGVSGSLELWVGTGCARDLAPACSPFPSHNQRAPPSLNHATIILPSALNSSQPPWPTLGLGSTYVCSATHP